MKAIMMKNKKGIALIMAIGILALLAVIATSFALSMRMEYRAASNYYNGVKANYHAEAAVERAIFELKTHVQASAFDNLTEQWALSPAYADNIDEPNDTISEILDEQRKANVNTGNVFLLGTLFQELGMSAIQAITAYNKINTRSLPNRGYNNIQELVSIAGLTDTPGGEYETIKDYITVSSYVDATETPIIIGANTGRAPINVNTADLVVLKSVLNGVAAQSDNLAQEIYNRVRGLGGYSPADPFTSWSEFDSFIDGLIGGIVADIAEASLIKDNCNPNRSNNKVTTEFCFNSGGYYEIVGTGTVGPAGQEIATREIKAIVRIYDIYTQTTKDDFRDEDLNGNNSYDASLVESGSMTIPGGYYSNYYDYNEDGDTDDTVNEDLNGNGQFDRASYDKITWLDSCPVNAADLFGDYELPSDYEEIHGSLKLGYWDDFELKTYAYTLNELEKVNQTWVYKDTTGDGDLELYSQWPSDYGKFALYGSRWTFGDFALRVFEKDSAGGGPKDQAWILFRGIVPLDPSLLLAGSGELWWGTWGNKIWAWQVNKIDPVDPTQRLMDDPIQVRNAATQWVDKIYYANDATATGGVQWFPPLNQRYPYPDALKLWPNSNLQEVGNWNEESDSPPEGNQPVEYYTPCTLSGADNSDSKTFNLFVQGSIVDAYAYRFSGDGGGYVSNDFWPVNISNATGRIGLYGQGLYPSWDELRIIPDTGTYTSKNLRPEDIDSDVGYDVNWCTVAATVTIPSADPTSETITLETRSVDYFGTPDIWRPLSGDLSDSLHGTSIQYRATLSTNNSALQETPVLEDIVITYLPRTEMASYTLSP